MLKRELNAKDRNELSFISYYVEMFLKYYFYKHLCTFRDIIIYEKESLEIIMNK